MVSEKVLRIIKKSLALAGNNPNEHEAQAAMLKAQELMAKHGLSMSDLDVDIPGYTPVKEAVETFATQPTKLQWWQKELANVIGNNFRCYTYWRTRAGKSRLIFMGLKDDTMLAKEVFQFACKTIEFCSIDYLDRRGVEGLRLRTAIRNDYIAGFISGLRQKFAEQVEKNDWGLILVKDAVVESKYSSMKFQKDQGSQASNMGDMDAMMAGYRDGKSMDHTRKRLNPGK